MPKNIDYKNIYDRMTGIIVKEAPYMENAVMFHSHHPGWRLHLE